MKPLIYLILSTQLLPSVHPAKISLDYYVTDENRSSLSQHRSLQRILNILQQSIIYRDPDTNQYRIPHLRFDKYRRAIITSAEDIPDPIPDPSPFPTDAVINEQSEKELLKIVDLVSVVKRFANQFTPRIEAKGRDDYLVMADPLSGPAPRIPPNDIYGPYERKCVNWLENCSWQGVKAKYLQKINSPYRKFFRY